MAGSKSDRKKNSKLDIFASNKDANDSVRVGYIDPKRGYVDGLSVYQANKYAEKNPGTRFIFVTRDKIKYVNINQVNKLKNSDTIPKSVARGLVDENGEFDPCNTVRGFNTNPDGGEPEIKPDENLSFTSSGEYDAKDNYKRYFGSKSGTGEGKDRQCRTRLLIQGGGGIGAVATPIIGKDGSILHARIISGGFGYKFPPQVRIVDDCKRGSGARAISRLGFQGYTEENYDDADDFEDYDFTLKSAGGDTILDTSDIAWGQLYSLGNQTVIGEWNPANVISLTNDDSFSTRLQEYLRFLKGYDPNKPWWTTRDEVPVRVVGDGTAKKANKLGGILYPVEHWAWGGTKERDDLFVDVEFEVYGQGTFRNRNLFFLFKAEDGSHQFRVRGVTNEARSGKTRKQVIKVLANTTYKVTSNARKRIEGSEKMVLEQGLLNQIGRKEKEIGGDKAIGKTSKVIFADVVGSLNDNDDIQVRANIGRFKAGDRTGVSVDPSKKKAEKFKDQKNRFKRGTFELTYRINRRNNITFTKEVFPSFMNDYAVAPQFASDKLGTDKADKPYTLLYREFFPHKGVYTFRAAADNQGEVFLDNQSIMDITDTFKNNSKEKKITVEKGEHDIRIDLLNFPQKKIVEKTFTSDGRADRFKKVNVKFNVVGSGSGRHRKIKCIFTNKADPTETFTIENNGDNKEVREVQRPIIANSEYDVKFIATAPKREDAYKETTIPIILATPGTKGRGKKARIGKVERKKIKYLDEKGDDPNAQLSIDSTSPGLTARFSDDGTNLITKGNGNVTLKFKWDDNPRSAGKAVGELIVADKTFKQKGEKGEERQTVYVGSISPCDPIPERSKIFPITYDNLNPNNDPINVSRNRKKIFLKDGGDRDTNATITIEKVEGGVATFTPDGRGIDVKGDCDVTISFNWDDNPNTRGVALDYFKINNKFFRRRGESDTIVRTINLKGTGKRPRSYASIIEQGCVENGTKNKETRASSSRVFGDYLGSANDNDDMQVFVKKGGIFTSSNRRRIDRHGAEGGERGRGTFDLSFNYDMRKGGFTKDLWQELKDQNIIDAKTGQALERSDLEVAQVFNTKEFIDKANRPLYRMRPGVGPYGDFFNRNGITPFNPLEMDPAIEDVKPTVPAQPEPKYEKPKVKFVKRSGETFLKVIGTGKVKIGFKLKTDDNFKTSGVFAKEVKIQADGPDVILRRTEEKKFNASGKSRFQGRDAYTRKLVEEETIKGEGTFTAGKEYKIKSIGGSPTSGFKPVDQTVVFDDDISNGLDDNGTLSIRYVRPIDPPKPKAPKDPKNGKNQSSKKSLDNVEGSVSDYAGIHKIIWKDIYFPASGTYTVDVQVDDNVRLEIFNRRFRAQVLDVKGFRGPGKSRGMQSFAIEVQKGTYTLQAFLQQIPGKSIVDGNPMGLAVNIRTAYVTVKEEITINQSWNENPFGVALTIHAPPPPIPQEPPLKQDGPCPPNPVWTTRHKAKDAQWHPCNHIYSNGTKSWSSFMNRYAMSPVLPIGTKGSGYSGDSWTNVWEAEIPFPGFYNFKGTVDNKAFVTILQDPGNSEVTEPKVQEIKQLDHFNTEKKDLTSNKIYLEKGQALIGITVTNGEVFKTKLVTKKVFSTADWVAKSVRKDKPLRVPVEFEVYGHGSKKNMGLKFVFKEMGGNHTFTIDNVEKSRATEKIEKRVKRNTDYKVTAIATGTHTLKNQPPAAKERTYNIKVADRGSLGRGNKAAVKSVSDKVIKFTDSTDQMDTDAEFRIKSPSPGLTAKFRGSNDNDLELVVKGDGDLSLELYWNDDPNSNGESVGNIKVAGETWKQTAHKDKEDSITKTIKVGNSNTSSGSARKDITKTFPINYNGLNPNNNPINVNNKRNKIFLKDGGDRDTNAEIIIEDVDGGTAKFTPDGRSIEARGNCSIRIALEWDDNPNTKGVALESFEIGGKVWRQKGEEGEKVQTITLNATQKIPAIREEVKLVPEQGTSRIFGRGKKGTESQKPGQIIFADIIGSANDNDDMQIRCNVGVFTPSNKRKKVKGTSGQGTQRRNTWDLTYRYDDDTFSPENITEVDGATYDIKDKETSELITSQIGRNKRSVAPLIKNPTLTTYKRGTLGPFLSPFFAKGRKEGGDALQGRTWEMVWKDVEFPVDGEYTFKAEADDILDIEVSTESVRVNVPRKPAVREYKKKLLAIIGDPNTAERGIFSQETRCYVPGKGVQEIDRLLNEAEIILENKKTKVKRLKNQAHDALDEGKKRKAEQLMSQSLRLHKRLKGKIDKPFKKVEDRIGKAKEIERQLKAFADQYSLSQSELEDLGEDRAELEFVSRTERRLVKLGDQVNISPENIEQRLRDLKNIQSDSRKKFMRKIDRLAERLARRDTDGKIKGEATMRDKKVVNYQRIGRARTFQGVKTFVATIKAGKRNVKLTLQNAKIPGTTFKQNPVVAACKITCQVPVEVEDQRSWLINPVGVSAVLISPPCNRVIGGIGTVREIDIIEPGNSHPPDPPDTPGVPSTLIIDDIIPEKPGIGYTPGDTATIIGTGVSFPITTGPFGKVTAVGVTTDIPITTYPKIDISTSTGTGFVPRITTKLIIDTPTADPEDVIQVTDLAGLKQNGYIEGRPYYGEVFFKDGVPFAGRYETAGRLIQVYATLQESIDGEVTTRPSAIQRSGTDVNSNNPRLNIPGTPDNLA